MVGRAESNASCGAAKQMNLDIGALFGEQVQGHHRQLIRAPRSAGAAVVADAGSSLCGASIGLKSVVLGIAPEVEVIGGHPVVAAEHLRKPPAGRDSVEAKAVGSLGQEGLAAGRVKPGL